MDLFYSNLPIEDQLRALVKDILNNENTKKKKLSIINGDIKDIGNNILFVLPHVTQEGFLRDLDAQLLLELIEEYKITKNIITYSYLLPVQQVTRNELREFSVWVEKLIDIIQPRLIVMVGEDTTLTFSNRKIKIENNGSIVMTFNGIPCMLTFSPSYYTEHSAYENERYKNYIKQKNWTEIKKEYERLIKEE